MYEVLRRVFQYYNTEVNSIPSEGKMLNLDIKDILKLCSCQSLTEIRRIVEAEIRRIAVQS
jgi:hypothetical protein